MSIEDIQDIQAGFDYKNTYNEEFIYCLGFLFINNKRYVSLIRKEKPPWQKGYANGIGGKVELGETPSEAMTREFEEETGCFIGGWIPFCLMRGKNWDVFCFKKFLNNSTEKSLFLEKKTEEQPFWQSVIDLEGCHPLPNIRWLVSLALDEGAADGPPVVSVINYK